MAGDERRCQPERMGDAVVPTDEVVTEVPSVHANVHNHFDLDRHLVDRQAYKTRRSTVPDEWQLLTA
jgi:hypothetical protein